MYKPSGNSSTVTPAATQIPVTTNGTITSVVTTQAPVVTTIEVTTAPTAASSTTISTSDPILHRWVRQYPQSGSSLWVAYEYEIFILDGSVVYNYGTPKETMSNIQVVSQLEMSGTWTKTGNTTYLIKVLPVRTAGGSPLIHEYTWVPAAKDPQYGYIVPEHIVSQDEIDQYTNLGRDLLPDEMKYPERAKID